MTAVCVRGACKQYGSGSKAHTVLQGLDMTVERGTIYGLLGASGCGKTTLLTCIVGRRRLGSGDIWVLGGKPGTRGSGVPGPRLGYMPQELSLMREFSVRDALEHFSWIYGMPEDKFQERYMFLEKLLDLPPGNTRVKNLSGGQQRRTSLAVSLIHDPELLILDEPTVGLDPVLRQNIWDHLMTIAAQGKTIIITTHYIEEARQAHRIGLMRSGRLMDEGSPEELLQRFNCTTVEKVFLHLSQCQDQTTLPNTQHTLPQMPKSTRPLELSTSGRAEFHNVPETVESAEIESTLATKISKLDDSTSNETQSKINNICSTLFFKKRGHAKALLSKNFYRIIRHPGAILFIFLFPMLEICAFYFAVGGWPRGMQLGVVNEELGIGGSCRAMAQELGSAYGGTPNKTEDGLPYCHLRGLSCKFLDMLDDSIANKVYFDDLESGMKEAKAGHLIGLLHFAQNYSQAFEARLDLGNDASNDTVLHSELPVWMDMSLRQSALLVEQRLRDTHTEYLKTVFRECKISEKIGNIPLHVYEPLFGQKEFNFTQFMTPGVVVTARPQALKINKLLIDKGNYYDNVPVYVSSLGLFVGPQLYPKMIFFISVGVTAMIIVVERLDGIWDRTLCAGVSSKEILLAHIILETGVIILQTAEVFIFVFYIFKMPCLGSYLDIVILLFLQGFTGMCGGFLVSVSCNTITASNFVSMGSFYPVLILSGLLWPVEGMPPALRFLSIGMPTTLATTALRNIMEKGWGMFDNYVYQGYLVSIIWIIIFSILSLTIIKLRK